MYIYNFIKNLLDTDYADFVKEYNETDTTSLKILLKKKLAHEIDYIQTVAGPDLQNFIQIVRHRYMIDNVISIIEGSKGNTKKDIIISRLEPLGYLPEITGLLNMDMKKLDDIYEDILIDTEVGYYFSTFLEEILSTSESKQISTIQTYLSELKPDKIKNYLQKIWLEYFYLFCQKLNSTTREMMTELLSFEADQQALQIVYNSLKNEFNVIQEGERRKIIPYFGI